MRLSSPLLTVSMHAGQSGVRRNRVWTPFFLDCRMAITSMDLYAIDMLDEEAVAGYTETLTGKAEELPCNARKPRCSTPSSSPVTLWLYW